MGTKILAWYLCWPLTCSCRICCLVTQSTNNCTTTDPNLGTSSKNNLSNSTLPTGIKPSLSSFGLSGLLVATGLSIDCVPSPFLHPVSSFCQDKNCKGNILPSQIEDPLSFCLIKLKTSGLWQSPQIAGSRDCGIHYIHHATRITMNYTTKAKAFILLCLQISWRSLDI
jgi:hypothetical protein